MKIIRLILAFLLLLEAIFSFLLLYGLQFDGNEIKDDTTGMFFVFVIIVSLILASILILNRNKK